MTKLPFGFSDDENWIDDGTAHHNWLLSKGCSYCSVCNKRIG